MRVSFCCCVIYRYTGTFYRCDHCLLGTREPRRKRFHRHKWSRVKYLSISGGMPQMPSLYVLFYKFDCFQNLWKAVRFLCKISPESKYTPFHIFRKITVMVPCRTYALIYLDMRSSVISYKHLIRRPPTMQEKKCPSFPYFCIRTLFYWQ